LCSSTSGPAQQRAQFVHGLRRLVRANGDAGAGHVRLETVARARGASALATFREISMKRAPRGNP
jgi:hypothetical protein